MHNLTILVLIFGCVSVSCSCPSGWQQYREKCYYISHMTASFPEAVSYCHAMKSILAEPRDPTENNFLEGIIKQQGGTNFPHYYIGVIDYVVEGIYMYASTLEEVAHPDWGNGEPIPPSIHVDEDCVVISDHRDDKWADVVCSSKCSFVCERPLISTQTNPLEPSIIG